MKTISTTALSKELGVTSKELFDKLVDLKLIYRKENKWSLTDKGKEAGGKIVANEQYGDFIAWPENLNPFSAMDNSKSTLINVTKIGEAFNLSNQRVNKILSELGWIEEAIKGWNVTNLGKKVGGLQREHQSGGTFVLWPETIINDPIFLRSIKPSNANHIENPKEITPSTVIVDKPANKYPDTLLKTKDGHLVRSRAELIIDNMLYDYGLTHAYERELPVAEKVLSDFYIPSKNGGKAVYIEFWGINDNEKYLERKRIKQEIYKKYNLNLIEIEDKHIDNLDGHLPKLLLKFNINVE
ncbi:MAG TPA: hypothetical protein VGP43_02710 [Chitinophagaceae bacterium]|nr:hypothetical protein [Chitinophagaceae bacterium]